MAEAGFTKGTKSQYAAMGLGYPLKDTTARTVSSPYGPRPHLASDLDPHLGLDLGYSGKKIVAVADGEVVYVRDKSAGLGGGNMVAYKINAKDPVTGNELRFINMHMRDTPVWESGPNKGKPIVAKDKVEKGQVIGYSYNTSSHSGVGHHLHFEAYNNTDNYVAITTKSLENRINPSFFYPNVTFTDDSNSTCGLYYDIDPKYKK